MRPIFVLQSLTSGAVLGGALMDRVTRLRVVDVEGIESDTLELDIDDRDADIELPGTGEKLHLFMGYAGGEIADMGRFVVDEIGVSGPPRTLTVSAKGADMLGGLKAPRVDTSHDARLGELVRKIAARHNLIADVHEDVENIPIGHVDQVGESDIAVLTRLADQNDLTLKIDGTHIRLRPHAGRLLAKGNVAALGAVRVRGREASRYDWRSTSRTKYGAVRSSYYDIDRATRVPVTVGDPDAGPVLELRHDARDAEEAARLASARADQLARGTGKLTLTLPGRPGLRSGMALSAVDFRDGIDGAWVVERAEHTLGRNGYVTRVECVPPGDASGAGATALDQWFSDNDNETTP